MKSVFIVRRLSLLLSLSSVLLLSSPGEGQQKASSPPDLLTPPVEKPARGVSYPSISPDGKTLCFSYLGDLWSVSAEGGVATRLTVHEGQEALSRWSPDGKWIAFTSLRTGSYDIFLVPAQGGSARQVTFHSASDWICDWSADGTKILFYSNRDSRYFDLYSLDLKTRALQKIVEDTDSLRYGNWSEDGKQMVYTRAGQPWYRAWYRGSVAAQTVVRNVETGKVRRLLKTPGQQYWPFFAPDGKSVYVTMIYGDGNTPNIWRVPTAGGSPKAVTQYTTGAVRFPCLARNGSRLTYVYEGELYTIDTAGGEPKKPRVIARSDDKVNNEERQTLTQDADESEPSPDGKQLALVMKGEIWLMPITGGEATRLTDHPANDHDILWSPDGTKLAVISDRDNQTDVYVLDIKSKEMKRLTNDPVSESHPLWSPDGKWIAFAKAGSAPGLYLVPSEGGEARRVAEGNDVNNAGIGIASHNWSPDSRWLAFARMDRFENRDIWVVPAVGGEAVNVTRYSGYNSQPQFSKDGRNLLFLSSRSGPLLLFRLPLEPEEDDKDADGKPKQVPDRSKDVRIDFQEIHERAVQVTPPMGNVEDFAITPDSKRIVVRIANNFWVTPMGGGGGQQLNNNNEPGGAIRILPDASRFFFIGANGTPRSMALNGGPVSVVRFTANYVFDRRALYRQAFDEFYRRFGTQFYDAKMHGVDWKRLRARYEPRLEGVGTSQEFAELLSMMVGEVNSSHSEVNASMRPGFQTATLGLEYAPEYAGPGLKVSSVLAKGPADKPASRIMPGEYILSVDGNDIPRLSEEYHALLTDKSGKTVEVLVNSRPTKEGARTVKLKAISSTEWINLDYEAWVKKNRERVEKLSDGRLGYLHIRGMDQPSLRKFEREFYTDTLDKAGLVLDIRSNGGGNTHDALLNILSRKMYGFTQPRDGLRVSQPNKAFAKPIVLLIDEHSASDAEIFPSGFRALGLGKVVGVTTPGYVIGTYEGRLVDGTSYRLPTWAFYTEDGKNMENLGIVPDIVVENTPEDTAAGKDRQLDVAVQTALSQVSEREDSATHDNGVLSSANANANGGSSEASPPRKEKANEKAAGS